MSYIHWEPRDIVTNPAKIGEYLYTTKVGGFSDRLVYFDEGTGEVYICLGIRSSNLNKSGIKPYSSCFIVPCEKSLEPNMIGCLSGMPLTVLPLYDECAPRESQKSLNGEAVLPIIFEGNSNKVFDFGVNEGEAINLSFALPSMFSNRAI